MSELPCLFVSHSSRDNEITRQLCDVLRAEGAGPANCELVVDFEKLQNYDVLVDVDGLQSGKPWPKQLHEWMARCHAAVLLLTGNAIRSPWVLKEATILAWRLSLDPNFRFLTVRFADVTDSDLAASGFDPLMLGEIQTLQGGDAASIAAELRKSIGDPPAEETPYRRLCDSLEDLAQDVKENTLKRLAEKMQLEQPRWRPDMDSRKQYVQTIVTKLLSEGLGGYDSVDQLVDELMNTTPTETVEKILYIVAPHWVDAEAAGRLPSIAARQPRRAISMNGVGVSDFTAEMYVRKACPLSRALRVMSIPGGNSGDLVDHVTRELYWQAHREQRKEGAVVAFTAEQKDDVERHFSKVKLRNFVVLCAPHPSGSALDELMARFPKLVFILWTGEELSDAKLDNVLCLKPPVEVVEEERQWQAYQASMELIRNKP